MMMEDLFGDLSYFWGAMSGGGETPVSVQRGIDHFLLETDILAILKEKFIRPKCDERRRP
jgi:hypothetical protein